MPAVEIRPGIHWIGVNDRTTDLFEGLWPITQEGVSYNAYLIDDEKKALIDLAKGLKTDEFGFLTSEQEQAGLLAAGCAKRPTDVATCVRDATGVVMKALTGCGE